MAQRRMFSPQIVGSEEFLSMPVSSRELYFQLGMSADDDGFIQPKLTMRITGASDDDLKVLLTKRFLLPFQSGVVVIKHWLIHNLIQKDRYHPTRFQDEKKTLYIKENKAYTDSVNKMLPQVRLGKVSISPTTLRSSAELANKNSVPIIGNELTQTDADIEVVACDEDGNPISKKGPNLNKIYNQMLDHMAKQRVKITNEPFEFKGLKTGFYKPLKIMREQFKLQPQDVYDKWDELCYEYNDSKFLKQKGFGLYDIITRLTKKG